MKKMYNVNKNQFNSKKNVITVDPKKMRVRNELHFQACLNSNVAYVEKNKKKIIPRKQKYQKSIDF